MAPAMRAREMSMSQMKTSRLFACILLAVGLVASSCSCGGNETQRQFPVGVWEIPKDPSGDADFLVDFGAVPVGTHASQRFSLRNQGNTALMLQAEGSLARPFSSDVGSQPVEIPVGGAVEVGFGFLPSQESETPEETVFVLASNERGAPTFRIRLQGRGVKPTLDCTPSPLEFGKVVRDTTKALTTVCENRLSVPLELVIEGFRGNFRQAFTASAPGDEASSIPLAAGGSISIRIEFAASSLGPNDAALVLRDWNGQLLAQIDVVATTVQGAVELDPADCLDFGLVPVGTSAERSFQLRNLGAAPLQVLSASFPPTSQAFTFESSFPISLGIDDEVEELRIAFTPETGGPQATTLELRTDDERPGSQVVSSCARGVGGGPKLSCSPAMLDFGMVAVQNPYTRTFLCMNDGFAPAGMEVDNLFVDSVEVAGAEFSAVIRNEDGGFGAKEEGYAIGEGFVVEVTYDPADEGFDEGEVALESSAAVGGVHVTRLAGQGRNLDPCDFSILPPSVGFGVVDVGEVRTATFHVVNHQTSACLLSRLHLSEDSDPAFSVNPFDVVEIPGDGNHPVEVTFAPTEYREQITGEVRFEISNPARRDQVVPLRGTAAPPCLLLDPEEVDFGNVGPGCRTPERKVTVANTCGRNMTLTEISILDSLNSDYFDLRSAPVLPRVLQPNERVEFGLIYNPARVGEHTGTVALSVEGGEPYHAGLRGVGVVDATQTERFRQRDRPKVDLLWVMDNSSSFRPYQERISANVGTFLQVANDERVDWQVAVTSSGLTEAQVAPTQPECPGGAKGGEAGRFFPIDGSHPRILTPTQPNLGVHWAHNMMVGDCFGGDGVEQPLEAAFRALSPPLINEVKSSAHDSPWDDGNAGFIRRDAALAVIFVTDDRDHSDFGRTPQQYADFFLSLKDQRLRDMVKVHAITLPKTGSPAVNCARATPAPRPTGDRIIEVVEATGGHWLNICTPTSDTAAWTAGLRAMSRAALGSFTPRFYLDSQPGDANGDGVVNEEDLQIWVDGEELLPIRNGTRIWSYDPVSRTVDFSANAAPKPGADLWATFKVECIIDEEI